MNFVHFTTIEQVREHLSNENDRKLLDDLILKAENMAIKEEIEKEIARLNDQLSGLETRTLTDNYYPPRRDADFVVERSTQGMLIGEYVKTYLRKALASNQIPCEEIEPMYK